MNSTLQVTELPTKREQQEAYKRGYKYALDDGNLRSRFYAERSASYRSGYRDGKKQFAKRGKRCR